MKEQIKALLDATQKRLDEYVEKGGEDTEYLDGKIAGLREAHDLACLQANVAVVLIDDTTLFIPVNAADDVDEVFAIVESAIDSKKLYPLGIRRAEYRVENKLRFIFTKLDNGLRGRAGWSNWKPNVPPKRKRS